MFLFMKIARASNKDSQCPHSYCINLQSYRPTMTTTPPTCYLSTHSVYIKFVGYEVKVSRSLQVFTCGSETAFHMQMCWYFYDPSRHHISHDHLQQFIHYHHKTKAQNHICYFIVHKRYQLTKSFMFFQDPLPYFISTLRIT
jgi:hypothetical protein